jgi:ADP-ribose pyrophosphatase YjhB (NUDIX family)
VTRGHGDGRELLVLEAEDGEPRLPGGAFEPEERVDSAAYRAVRAATGVALTSIPRPLGIECHAPGTPAEERTRIVWLDAPEGLEPEWTHGAARCRFVPLVALSGLDDRAPVARIAAAV